MRKQRNGRRQYVRSGARPGPKRGLTAELIVRRNVEMVRKADRGVRYPTLAAEYGLTENTVGQIVRRYRADRRKLLDEDEMVDHVNSTLASYDQAIEDLALLRIPEEHPAAIVGALRLKLDTIRAKWELLQAIGYVPQNLSHIRVQLEASDVANEVVAVLDAYEGATVDDHLWDAMISALEGRPWRGPGGALPPGSGAPGADYEGSAEELPHAA